MNEPTDIRFHIDQEVGLTMFDTVVKQLPDGNWEAVAPIGSIFGAEVEGNCRGVGSTKEIALAELKKDRQNLSDSLWA